MIQLTEDQKALLESSIMWLLIKYDDGSARFFNTTLNRDILSPVLDTCPGEGYLYNLDRQKWTTLRSSEGVTIELSEDRPKMGAFIEFVNKYV
jgi:hypothetical protein